MSVREVGRSRDYPASPIAVFWLLVIFALYVFGWAQTAQLGPPTLHGWNEVVTVVLIVTSALWFAFVMLPDVRRRLRASWLLSRVPHLVVAVGAILVVSLSLLHGPFVGLVFACIGVTVFIIDGWTSLIPVSVLAATFIWVTSGSTGVWRSHALTQIGIALFSVIPVVVVVYSLVAVTRQRAERDRLIEELRVAQGQLQKANRDLRIALARDVEVATLRERNRLAREMHDSIGHALVLIAMKIEAGQRLQRVDPNRAGDEWESTKSLVRETMAELRTSLAGLRLPALDEQAFGPAMTDLCTEVESRAGLAVTVTVPDSANGLCRPIQETLYRVTQEALNNATIHARARQAGVRIETDESTVVLEICDDGVGLGNAPRSAGERFGVVGMRERVEALGGRFTIGPAGSAGGTVVRAVIPQQEVVDARHSHPVG